MFNIRESVLNFKEKHTHTLFFFYFQIAKCQHSFMTDPLNIIFYDFSI